jgi:hypothetical protein
MNYQSEGAQGGFRVTSKRRMILAWLVIISVVVGVSAIWGGRDCEVPKSGPFHWLMSGHPFVQRLATASRNHTCRKIYDDTSGRSESMRGRFS